MQSQRLFSSRSGIAFVQRFASSSKWRLPVSQLLSILQERSSFLYSTLQPSFSPYPLNTRWYSTDDPQSVINNGGTNREVASQPRSNRALDFSTSRCAERTSEESRQALPQVSESLTYYPKHVLPNVEPRPEQGVGWKVSLRTMRRSDDVETAREEEMGAEARSYLGCRCVDYAQRMELSRTPWQEAICLGKTQRLKTAKVPIWLLLEQAEQQLELTQVRLDTCTLRFTVNHLSIVIEKQLKRVNMQMEIWGQLDLAEHQLELAAVQLDVFKQRVMINGLLQVIEMQLKRSETRLEVWRELILVENMSKIIHEELAVMEWRTAMWEQLYLSEKEVHVVNGSWNPLGRLSEAWESLVMVEKQIEVVGNQPNLVNRQLEMYRRTTEVGTIQSNPTRRRFQGLKFTPSSFLNEWLDISDSTERERYWLNTRGHHRRLLLPVLLVACLRLSDSPKVCLACRVF